MASSGTYSFNPSIADLVVEAFDRCQIRRTDLTQERLSSARLNCNLILQEWAIKGIQLWAVELGEIDLVAGQATYDLPVTCSAMLDTYIRTQPDADQPQDRILWPIDRTDYASYPNKLQQGQPTVFWFQRDIAPKVTLWTTPDSTQDYVLRFYYLRQLQDAAMGNGQTPDLPLRFTEAYIAALAHRMARNFAPALEDKRKMDANEAWALAAGNDTEDGQMTISPQLMGYYR